VLTDKALQLAPLAAIGARWHFVGGEESPADPARDWAPALHFTIVHQAASDQPIGLISLRLGASGVASYL